MLKSMDLLAILNIDDVSPYGRLSASTFGSCSRRDSSILNTSSKYDVSSVHDSYCLEVQDSRLDTATSASVGVTPRIGWTGPHINPKNSQQRRFATASGQTYITKPESIYHSLAVSTRPSSRVHTVQASVVDRGRLSELQTSLNHLLISSDVPSSSHDCYHRTHSRQIDHVFALSQPTTKKARTRSPFQQQRRIQIPAPFSSIQATNRRYSNNSSTMSSPTEKLPGVKEMCKC